MDPNLFIVGAPRTGSTALHGYLSMHPGICMSNPKEPNFFCRDFHAESDAFHSYPKHYNIREPNDYLAIWSHFDGERVIGEASTAYLASTESAKAIHEFNSDAKIIVMLRDPADLLISLHCHLKWLGVEPITDLEKALLAEPERRRGRLPKHIVYPSGLYYSNRVQFKEQIERYREWFADEQLLMLFTEEMRQQQVATYRRILEFVGVDESFVPDFDHVNERVEVKSLRLHRILKRLLRTRLPRRVDRVLRFRKLVQRAVRMNIDRKDRSEAIALQRARLHRRFRPQVLELGEYLGRDLIGFWRYKEEGEA